MKSLFKISFGLLGFSFLYGVLAIAQVVAPSASPVVAIPAGTGVVVAGGVVAALIASKGGLLGFIVLCVSCFNILASGIRDLLCKWDGVAPGDQVNMEKFKALSLANKAALISGKLIDYVQGNVQH